MTIKVGFTVGVFDLFHHGHERFLERAAQECTHLVVGVTTDWLTRVQKGHNRPAESFETRFLKVQRHKSTWKAIAIDDLDVSQYLQIADVWILGGDQKNMKPFLSPISTIRLPLTPGVSTTMLLKGE